LMIQAGASQTTSVSAGSGTSVNLTEDDLNALRERCEHVLDIAPIVRSRTQIVYGSKNWQPFYIYGTTPNFLYIREWSEMAEGEPFTDEDVQAMREVCLLGYTVAKELFGEDDPIGQKVRINNRPF